jgi:hypothetical protein
VKASNCVSRQIVSLGAFAAALASPIVAIAQDGPATPAAEPAPSPNAPAAVAEPAAPAAEPAPAEPPSTTTAEPAEPPKTLGFAPSAPPSPAQKDEAEAEPDDGKLHHHQDHFLGFVGVRVGKVSSAGLDPFSDSDELTQFSVGLGKTLFTSGDFSLAGMLLYDIGGHTGQARNADADLTVHRLLVGAEARYHFIRQFFVFGRVAPGAVHSIAKLEDHTAGDLTLAAREWVFATDLSAGATLELTGWKGSTSKRTLGVWLVFDGGYGFAGESELSLEPDGSSGPERTEPVELGPLALGGPFLRFSAMLTY